MPQGDSSAPLLYFNPPSDLGLIAISRIRRIPRETIFEAMTEHLAIAGMGTAAPLETIRQTDAAEIAKEIHCPTKEQSEMLSTLYRLTRVQTRGSVLLESKENHGSQQSFFRPPAHQGDLGPTTGQRMERYEREAPLLALSAARRAFLESNVRPEKIGQLITVSCTGFMAPGIDLKLIQEFQMKPTVGRTHIGFMGCHGAFNGLRVASGLLRLNPDRGILLSSVELSSLHFHYAWDPEKIVANALFSDGAGSLIGVAHDSAPPEAWRLAAQGSCVFPDSEEAMSWRIRDHGFEMTLSPSVPALLRNQLQPWLKQWLNEIGIPLKRIRSWAIHPGGPRILSEIAHGLDLKKKDVAVSEEILNQYGNMSSSTLFFILERLRLRRAPRPCLALGFGPGLAVEAAIFL